MICFYQSNFFNFDCTVADKKEAAGNLATDLPVVTRGRLRNFVLRRPYCSEQDRLGDVFNTEVFARTGGMTEAGSIGLLTVFCDINTSRNSQSIGIHWGGIYEYIKLWMSVGKGYRKHW